MTAGKLIPEDEPQVFGRCGVVVSQLDFGSDGPGSIPSTVISPHHIVYKLAFSMLKSLRSSRRQRLITSGVVTLLGTLI